MAVYGYARVSTTDQDLSIQIDALKAAGCSTIRSEKVSGTSTQGRDELNTLLEFIHKRRCPYRHAHRPSGSLNSRSTEHCSCNHCQRRDIKGHRAAHRYEQRGWQGFPRHAGRVRGV